MTDLRCKCEHCHRPITRTETIAARDVSGDLSSCLDCAEQLTAEEVEYAWQLCDSDGNVIAEQDEDDCWYDV